MVQRKVPRKLGIQAASDVKFEKRMANSKTSSQFHDVGKHRGADLKKKMKKSRSIKLSDMESLKSSPLRKNSTSQPRKPLPAVDVPIPNVAASPQKQPLVKTTYGSPNYMKPTSCSDARKEQSPQVSLRNSPVVLVDGKSQNRRSSSNTKLSSGFNKPERNLTIRTSGLKMARTLIKSPTFKPARPSAKKTSRVALCADMNAQRATCSSTLKDTKFPDYLMVNPGGTEAEGTSVMKVCPYTYCSLNGHHHSPVPPLKSFLSARRRSLKAQKMMKLQALSPRVAKQCNDGMEEIGFQKILFDENDKPAGKEADVAGMDFFVEIYAASKEDEAEAIGRGVGADSEEKKEDYKDLMFPNDASDEGAAEENYANSLVEEKLSDRSSTQSESDSEAESFEDFPADENYGPVPDQEDTATGRCSNESDFDEHSSIEVGYASSKTTDMEWEEGQFSTDVHEEVPLVKSDAIDENCNNIIEDYCELPLHGLLEQKNQSFEGKLNDGDASEQDEGQHNFEIEEAGQVYETFTYDQHSYTESGDAFKDDSERSETDWMETSSSSTAEPIEEIQEQNGGFEAEDGEIDSHLGAVESHCATGETDEASDSQAMNTFQDDETSKLAGGFNGSLHQENSETDQQELTIVVIAGNQMNETELVDDTNSSEEMQLLDSERATGEENDVKAEDRENCKKTNNNLSDGDQSDLRLNKLGLSENSTEEANMEVQNNSEPEATEIFIKVASNTISPGMKRKFSNAETNLDQELANACNYRKGIKSKRLMDEEEHRKFNPREPNYLPLVPDPEAEKVDLKHQTTDEKKNAEEWMLDFALQQAVTKLAPARKKKVALLVEAFEAVMPVPKYEARPRNQPSAFTHARLMQACS